MEIEPFVDTDGPASLRCLLFMKPKASCLGGFKYKAVLLSAVIAFTMFC